MNTKLLRIGILGAGHIAEKMAKTIAAMPDVTILAVASRSMEHDKPVLHDRGYLDALYADVAPYPREDGEWGVRYPMDWFKSSKVQEKR